MSYPKAVALKRLRNELKECSKYLGEGFSVDSVNDLPVTIDMEMHNALAYESEGNPVNDHRFTITFTEDYGMSKPEVRWKTHIFHPNILDPDDGGLVCTKMLNEWTFGMHLSDFLSSLELLLTNPRPENPFGSESCLRAAEFFSNPATFKATVHR